MITLSRAVGSRHVNDDSESNADGGEIKPGAVAASTVGVEHDHCNEAGLLLLRIPRA